MNKVITYIKENLFSLIVLLSSLVFYLFFAFYDGAVIYPDSASYIEMSFAREPFYPLFLAFLRSISPQNYLLYTVIFQSLLMAFCSWLLANYLSKKLQIHKIYSIILYALPIVTSLLCRFAAQRASMYTNSVLTEGICTSLYLFFIYCILKYLWDNSKIHIALSWLIAFIMISSRKQMLMVLPLLFLAIVYTNFNNQKLWRGIIIATVSCFMIFPAFKLFDCTYNYVTRGVFQGHSSSNRFVTTMVFYNAERSDADYIEDEDVKQLFLTIYDVCDKKGYLGSHAGDGWFHEVNHFGDHYDHIQINTMWPMIQEHSIKIIDLEYQTTDITEEERKTLYDKETDRLNSIMISSILPHQLPELVKSLFNNFLSGLVITVAQLRQILVPYTIVIFLAYFILTGRLAFYWYHNKNINSNNVDLASKNVIFAIITLLGIFFNVLLVSAVIFCQTRYTIYNMPLFYMAGAVLLYQNIITATHDQ